MKSEGKRQSIEQRDVRNAALRNARRSTTATTDGGEQRAQSLSRIDVRISRGGEQRSRRCRSTRKHETTTKCD